MKSMCILFGFVVLFAVVALAEDAPAVKVAEEPEDGEDVDINKVLEALEKGIEDGLEEAAESKVGVAVEEEGDNKVADAEGEEA